MSNFVKIKSKINKFNKKLSIDGDKSISIRSILLASQAVGTSKISNLLDKLNAYPTTYEEDAAILNAANDISPRLVAATRYRHSKKRIIMKQLEILNQGRKKQYLLQ